MFVNWDAVLVLLCLQHAAAHCVCGTEMLNATDSVPLVPVVSHHWSLFLSNAVADSEGVHLAPPPFFTIPTTVLFKSAQLYYCISYSLFGHSSSFLLLFWARPGFILARVVRIKMKTVGNLRIKNSGDG